MPISDYLSEKLIKHTFGIASYTAPANLYLALGSGSTEFGELENSPGIVTGYAREQIEFSPGITKPFPEVRNSKAVSFTLDTDGGEDWSFNQFAVYDALTGGNQLMWNEIDDVTVPDEVAHVISQERVVIQMQNETPTATDYWVFGRYLQSKLLAHVFAGDSYSAPSTIYLALCGATPGPDDGEADLSKLSGTGYDDASNSNWEFDALSLGEVSNSSQVDFPTAGGDWSPAASDLVLHDGTNVLFWAPMDDISIYSDDQPYFGVNSLDFALSG